METLKERYLRLKREGKCVTCAKEKENQEFVRCLRCRKKIRIAVYICQNRRKAKGICTSCTKPAKPGYVKCSSCREVERETEKRYVKEGKCTQCGVEIFDDSKYHQCINCRENIIRRRDYAISI